MNFSLKKKLEYPAIIFLCLILSFLILRTIDDRNCLIQLDETKQEFKQDDFKEEPYESNEMIESIKLNKPETEKKTTGCYYSEDPDNCPIIESDKQNRILVLGHQRSGSSFTANILQTALKTFYIFEPFGYFGSNSYLDRTDNQFALNEAMDILIDLFSCNMLNEKTYYGQIGNRSLRTNAFFGLKKYYKIPEKFYNMARVFCTRAKSLVFKLVRIDFNFVINFFNKIKHQNNSRLHTFKTLVLFRDPRAILNSRLDPNLKWCALNDNCRDPELICDRIRSNLRTLSSYGDIPVEIKNNLVLLRYEDLVRNTTLMTKKLFKRLGLDYTTKVENYLKFNTNIIPRVRGPKRNTTENSISWIKTFRRRNLDLNLVEQYCSDVMFALGYKFVNQTEINEQYTWAQLITDDFPMIHNLRKHFIN